jgi:hypothetical protein
MRNTHPAARRVALRPVRDAGRRAYRLCGENGYSMRVGLFVDRAAAGVYCGERGWRLLERNLQEEP